MKKWLTDGQRESGGQVIWRIYNTPEAQPVYSIEMNRQAGFLHKAEQRGDIFTYRQTRRQGILYTAEWSRQVYLISAGAISVREQSSDGTSLDGGGKTPQWTFPLELHPQGEGVSIPPWMRLWDPWHGHTPFNSTHSLRTSNTQWFLPTGQTRAKSIRDQWRARLHLDQDCLVTRISPTFYLNLN